MTALSGDTRNRLGYALGSFSAAKELADTVDAPLTDFPLASGKLVVGDVNGNAQPVTPAGDVTFSNVGATTVQTTKVASQAPTSIIKTATATVDVLAAAAATRRVIIAVNVDEVFANGNGAQTTITIGEEGGAADKFMLVGRLVAAAAGSGWIASGTLTAGKKLQATSVAATGTGTGGVTITVIAVG